jgi:hypothetical protein
MYNKKNFLLKMMMIAYSPLKNVKIENFEIHLHFYHNIYKKMTNKIIIIYDNVMLYYICNKLRSIPQLNQII